MLEWQRRTTWRGVFESNIDLPAIPAVLISLSAHPSFYNCTPIAPQLHPTRSGIRPVGLGLGLDLLSLLHCLTNLFIRNSHAPFALYSHVFFVLIVILFNFVSSIFFCLLAVLAIICIQDGEKRRNSGLHRLWRSGSPVECTACQTTEQTHPLSGNFVCFGSCYQPERLDLGHTRSSKCSRWRLESLWTFKRRSCETRMRHGAFILWLDAKAVRISGALWSLSRVWGQKVVPWTGYGCM